MILGAHESMAGGVNFAVDRAVEDGCEALQIFTRSSNQWRARPLRADEIAEFRKGISKHGLPVAVHGSYLMNLCSPDDVLWEKSIACLVEELERCDMLGIPSLVVHPGSHRKSGEEAGIQRISKALNQVFDDHPKIQAHVLLENTAGQGDCIGHRFEHLGEIRRKVRKRKRIGVCFDTCHAFAAGYDFRTKKGYQAMWKEFDDLVGLETLRAFHLNDCKKDLGCRVDRHENIGEGFIGVTAFEFLVKDRRFLRTPAFLETPSIDGDERAGFRKNLKVLRSLKKKRSA